MKKQFERQDAFTSLEKETPYWADVLDAVMDDSQGRTRIRVLIWSKYRDEWIDTTPQALKCAQRVVKRMGAMAARTLAHNDLVKANREGAKTISITDVRQALLSSGVCAGSFWASTTGRSGGITPEPYHHVRHVFTVDGQLGAYESTKQSSEGGKTISWAFWMRDNAPQILREHIDAVVSKWAAPELTPKNLIGAKGLAKQDAMKVISKLPATATMDDIMYELYVIDKVKKSKEESECGEVVSTEAIKKEIQTWPN